MILPGGVKRDSIVKLRDGSTQWVVDIDQQGQRSGIGHYAFLVSPERNSDNNMKWVGSDQIVKVINKKPYKSADPIDLGISSWQNKEKFTFNEIKSFRKILNEIVQIHSCAGCKYYKEQQIEKDCSIADAVIEKHRRKNLQK